MGKSHILRSSDRKDSEVEILCLVHGVRNKRQKRFTSWHVHRSVVLLQNEPRPSKIWTLVSDGSLKRDPMELCIVLTTDVV